MGLNKQHLRETFKAARENLAKFVFVCINADGVEEVIVIPEAHFDAKEVFYEGAYTDNLTHVMNKSVYIRGLSYGDSSELDNII